MTACGYTPDQLDDMAMADVAALLAYWRDAPPTHEILAAAYRVEPCAPTAAQSEDPSGIGGLIARFPDGRVTPV